MIIFKDVCKTYPNGNEVLKDFNLTINDGEFAFVLGPSGAGKSTFLKLLMHDEELTSGEIEVNGFKISKLKRKEVPYLRRSMGIVFQDFKLINDMTVFENVEFAMRVTNAPLRDIRRQVPKVLAMMGLSNKARRYPEELSGGEQQRVALARALVNNPSLIIADEPTGNIDPQLSYEIVEMLLEINRAGTTIVMVTHEHELVAKFDKRIIIIDKGHVVADSADRRAR